MEVPLSEIFHLERFLIKNEEFIKDSANPAKGNVTRYPGEKHYVFLPPETLVHRKKPDLPRN